MEERLREEKTKEKDVEGKRDQFIGFVKDLGSHAIGTVSKAIKDKDLTAMRGVGTGMVEDYQKLTESQSILKETQKEVNKEASDELLLTVKERFLEKWTEAQTQLERYSTDFCSAKTEEFKQMLLDLVTGSTALSEDQRTKLAGIIMEFHPMDYHVSADELFDKNKFLHRIFGDTDRLDIGKLTGQYNRNMRREVKGIFESMCTSHKQSFDAWRNSLVSTICENIVDFNPDLYNQSKIIEEENYRIQELEKRIQMLKDYTSQIREMMAWKES